ncbi:MAG: O-antigen ligase family protein [Flavobacteriaceae bacterium]
MVKNLRAEKVHFILLLIFSAVIPSGFYRFEGIGLVLLLASWIFLAKGYQKLKTIGHPLLLLILFYLLMILGLFYTNDVNSQWQYLGRKIGMLLIPLIFVGTNLDEGSIEKLKKAFIFSSIFFVFVADCYAVFDFLTTGESEIFISPSIYNKFTYYGLTRVFTDWHPTYVSLFLNLTLVFCNEIFYKKKKYPVWVLIGLFSILNIFLLNSFIGIFTFFILSILFLLKVFKKRKGFFVVLAAVMIGFGIAIYTLNPFQYAKIDKLKETPLKITDRKEERNVLTLRLAKWKSSIEVYAQAPILGVTNGCYMDELYQQYVRNGFEYCAKQRYSSHNQYLYTLTSNGFFGLLLLGVILTVPLWLKTYDKSLIPFTMIIGCFFLTEDLLARQQGMFFFVFFYVLLTQSTSESKILKE